MGGGLSRRGLLAGAIGASSALLAGRGATTAASAATSAGALPSAGDMYRDVKRMVDFGPRFPGSRAHEAYLDWLEREFRAAGCKMLPRDEIGFTRWLAEDWSLEILEGPGRGPVPLASYVPYSGPTPAAGVTGELVYVGPVPALALGGDPTDIDTLKAAIQGHSSQLADWAQAAIAAIPGGVEGRVVLSDGQCPPLNKRAFAALTTYDYDPGASPAELEDLKRLILSAFVPHSVFANSGALGVVTTIDASRRAAAGQNLGAGESVPGFPGVHVDRDTGDALRRLAQANPKVRLTLTASVEKAKTSQLVGILPGKGSTDEVMILNTHTDGQNAFEENGGVGLVHLARHFASKRLERSLVFSATSGHFATPSLPQTRLFIERHPDLVARAAVSLTLEHLGASEWLDDARGYHPTGRPDIFIVWHSQTPLLVPMIDTMVADDLRNSLALRPAGDYMIGVGTALHEVGVPTISTIVAPNYLVSWAENGHLNKFLPERAALEVRWAADLLTRFDAMTAEQLAAGDSAALRSGAACVDPSLPTCMY